MLNPTLHKAYYLVGTFTSSNAGGFSAGAPVFPFPKKNNNNISNFHFDLKRTISFKQFLD